MVNMVDPKKLNDATRDFYYGKMQKWLMQRGKIESPLIQIIQFNKLKEGLEKLVEKYKYEPFDSNLQFKINRDLEEVMGDWLAKLHRSSPETKNRLYSIDYEFNQGTLTFHFNENLMLFSRGLDDVIMMNVRPTRQEFEDWACMRTRRGIEKI